MLCLLEKLIPRCFLLQQGLQDSEHVAGLYIKHSQHTGQKGVHGISDISMKQSNQTQGHLLGLAGRPGTSVALVA